MKVKVVKQSVHDSDKVKTYLELGNTSLGSQVMWEWAQRGSSSYIWAGVVLRRSCLGAGSVF